MTMFAVVEIMGHRTRAGAIGDAQLGGATLLRIAHPDRVNEEGEPVVEYYAPAAIFAIRPCTEEKARKVAAWAWSDPVEWRALPAVAAPFVDEDDEDDEDDEANVRIAYTWDPDAEPF